MLNQFKTDNTKKTMLKKVAIILYLREIAYLLA